jgi:peptidoglycan/LPS O-acetylase OafA/YrhL
MDVALAIVVGAVGGGASGYVLKADGVPEWSRWFIVGVILFGMAVVLGIEVTAARSPEEFILDHVLTIGFPGVIAALVAGGLAYWATAEANSKKPGPPP